jgi:hypothetical protein
MPTFGKKAKDRVRTDHEFFLKTFKEPVTKIRFLVPSTDDFVEIKEHFDKAEKMSFPCAKYEGADACVGCDYPVEHPEWADLDAFGMTKDERKNQDKGWGVRDASAKFIFPALDEKGYVSVYKIGWNFYKDLKALHELVGPLNTVDYGILRAGDTWNSTSYQAQAVSAPYEREVKTQIPTTEVISGILGDKYRYALEKYGYDTGEAQAIPPVDPMNTASAQASQQLPPAQHVEPTTPGDAVSETLAAAKNARADKGLPGPATEPGDNADGIFVPREASAGEIKDWLAENSVEFPAKAPRTVLVNLAEKKMVELGVGPAF